MTVPMIINKINNYEKKLSTVKIRLAGAFYRTLGDSILPNSIEDGIDLISIAKDSMRSDTTLNLNTVRKKKDNYEIWNGN